MQLLREQFAHLYQTNTISYIEINSWGEFCNVYGLKHFTKLQYCNNKITSNNVTATITLKRHLLYFETQREPVTAGEGYYLGVYNSS